jgi:hypothetical protein
MKNEKASIRKINKEISGALKFWQDMLNLADADEWAYYLNYSDEDLFNALYIFNHVAQNIAIKNGFLDMDNAEQKMRWFCESIEECFGFNTIELTNKVLAKYGRSENTK